MEYTYKQASPVSLKVGSNRMYLLVALRTLPDIVHLRTLPDIVHPSAAVKPCRIMVMLQAGAFRVLQASALQYIDTLLHKPEQICCKEQ